MFRLMQLLGRDKTNAAAHGKDDLDSGAALLVITRDSDFYAGISEIVSRWKWTVCQKSEILLRPDYGPPIARRYSIVIYDGDSTNGNWKEAFVSLKATDGEPCILLASRVFDPYLRNEVIRRGGFDVIAKSAGPEQLMRTLRFAWFWEKKSQGQFAPLFPSVARRRHRGHDTAWDGSVFLRPPTSICQNDTRPAGSDGFHRSRCAA